MIPQQHEEDMQQREHLLPPVAEQPPAVSIEERSRQVPPSLRRWRGALVFILGIALPLVAGSMVWWPWGVPDIFDAGWVFVTVALSMALSVAVGAFLLFVKLRAWWGALLAPLAWVVGELLGAVVRPLVQGGWPALQALEHSFWNVQGVIIPMALLPLLFCAGLGTTGVLMLDALMRRQASPR